MCTHDWAREEVLGNLRDHTLGELWNGDRMREIRVAHQPATVRGGARVSRLFVVARWLVLSGAGARSSFAAARSILAAWVVVCVALLPAARSIESVLSVAARIDGSESAVVDEQLARRFHSPFAHSVVLVATGLPSPTTPAGEQALGALVGALRVDAGSHERSLIPRRPRVAPGRRARHRRDVHHRRTRGGCAPTPASSCCAVRRAGSRREMRRDYPRVALRWTGETALNADLRRASAADAQGAEMRALPVTLVLLLVAFGALAAALLPVAGGMLAIGISLGLASVVARVWPLSILLQNVVTMIGLGLGIDYSLLIVGRFRDELRARSRARAARRWKRCVMPDRRSCSRGSPWRSDSARSRPRR